jgi:hypothetical protein
MSLAKTEVPASAYIKTGKKEASDLTSILRKEYKKQVNNRSSIYTLWLLAIKHKIGLMMIGNIVLVLNWVMPEWPQVVLSLFNK